MRATRAIADPVRREILVMLRARPLTASAIAARFDISRPAVSRHLRVLRECGLVVVETRGRERVHRLDVGPLVELDEWLHQFGEGWSARFDALATEVHRTRRERRTHAGPTPAAHGEPTADTASDRRPPATRSEERTA